MPKISLGKSSISVGRHNRYVSGTKPVTYPVEVMEDHVTASLEASEDHMNSSSTSLDITEEHMTIPSSPIDNKPYIYPSDTSDYVISKPSSTSIILEEYHRRTVESVRDITDEHFKMMIDLLTANQVVLFNISRKLEGILKDKEESIKVIESKEEDNISGNFEHIISSPVMDIKGADITFDVPKTDKSRPVTHDKVANKDIDSPSDTKKQRIKSSSSSAKKTPSKPSSDE